MKRFSLFSIAGAGLVFFLMTGNGTASSVEQEIELFSKGYQYLFSYKPDKAADTFRIFMKEFPQSSVRDASMFWLGKTLIGLKSYNEAEMMFQTLQKEFPESPYIGFIEIELEEIAKGRSAGNVGETKKEVEFQKDIRTEETSHAINNEESDSKLTQLLADKEKSEALLEEERIKTAELLGLLTNVKEQQNSSLFSPGRTYRSHLEPDAVVRIGNREYPLAQIIDYHVSASLVFQRFGIKDVVWRTGNSLDDFVTEELLFLEAKKTLVPTDITRLNEMVKSRALSGAEKDYFEKFMIIARYIDTQYAEDPIEKWIELLTVDYRPGDVDSKTVLATDIQKAAREGKSFEEIGKIHPERVKFSRLSIQDFSAKYKEKSQIIQKLNFLNEETVVIWSEKGYMLIKPISSRAHFNPFEAMTAQRKEKLKAFLKQWLNEHRK